MQEKGERSVYCDWGHDWGQVLQSHIVVMLNVTPSASNLITPTL